MAVWWCQVHVKIKVLELAAVLSDTHGNCVVGIRVNKIVSPGDSCQAGHSGCGCEGTGKEEAQSSVVSSRLSRDVMPASMLIVAEKSGLGVRLLHEFKVKL